MRIAQQHPPGVAEMDHNPGKLPHKIAAGNDLGLGSILERLELSLGSSRASAHMSGNVILRVTACVSRAYKNARVGQQQ